MDTLQARIVQLEQENAALRALLKKHGIAYPETAENQISAIANQGSRMLQNEVTPQMVSFFYTYFRGRKDVYSVRSRPKDGKAGYFPVCTHFWDHKLCPKTTGQKIACRDCPNRAYKPLNIRALLAHLKGEREDSSDVVGIYPLLPDDTCYFLVFDFDDHEGTFQGSEKRPHGGTKSTRSAKYASWNRSTHWLSAPVPGRARMSGSSFLSPFPHRRHGSLEQHC